MLFLIILLTAVLLLDCLVLTLLVLMQLPKKEAGAGLAFGAGATDALFGAGSGNFLTKATKYAAIGFFVLTLVLAVMMNHYMRGRDSGLRRSMNQSQTPPAVTESQPAAAPNAAVAPATNTGLIPLTTTPAATNSAP